MNNRFIVFLVIFVGMGLMANAQKKELSLQEAVIGQWRQFYPKRLSNLQWRPDTDMVTYRIERASKIVQRGIKGKTVNTLFDLAALNKAMGETLEYIPSIRWESKDAFRINHQGTRITLSLNGTALKIESKSVAPADVANLEAHPASQQFAYTKDNNVYLQTKAGKELAITAEKDPNIVSGQAIARQEFGITKGLFWSPSGSHLAFYQKDESKVSDYPLLDISTTPGQLRSIKYPMAGQGSESAKVGIYNVKAGKMVYLAVTGPSDQYLTNLGWGPNDKFVYVAVVNRDQNHMWLNKYDANTGAFVKTLLEEENERYVEPEHAVWFLPTTDEEFLWWSERDGFMHLYRYNTEGKLLGQVTKGAWVTLSILGLDDSKKNLLVQGTDALGLNTTVYCAPLTGDKPSKRMVTQEGVHRFSLSSSGKYLLDRYSTINDPHVAQLINLKGKVLQELYRAEDPYKDYAVAKAELGTIKAEDGTILNTRLIKPADFDPSKKYPIVVYVYGGPHAQMIRNNWLANASLWMYQMANRGYLVFTVDNRGSSNRGFAFESVIHRKLGTAEMSDQLKGVEYLKTLPYADTDRMAIHGWSFGGYMTTSLMLKHPDVFKVGVAGGPVTDWNYYEIMYGERYMDRPEENPEGYKNTQLKNFAGDLKGDLLLIHGTIDDVVVMQHNLSLVQAFVTNGILMDFFPYPMHPHNVRGMDRVHLMNKVLTYIEDKLAPSK
ncbi:MAG: DPP IV N-terminal domain-containing protein [Aureispira sp.]